MNVERERPDGEQRVDSSGNVGQSADPNASQPDAPPLDEIASSGKSGESADASADARSVEPAIGGEATLDGVTAPSGETQGSYSDALLDGSSEDSASDPSVDAPESLDLSSDASASSESLSANIIPTLTAPDVRTDAGPQDNPPVESAPMAEAANASDVRFVTAGDLLPPGGVSNGGLLSQDVLDVSPPKSSEPLDGGDHDDELSNRPLVDRSPGDPSSRSRFSSDRGGGAGCRRRPTFACFAPAIPGVALSHFRRRTAIGTADRAGIAAARGNAAGD